MAGRSHALVSTDSSRRQTALERGSCGDVFVRAAAKVCVPGLGPRWARFVVPLRSEDDSPRGWSTVVHSWGRRRYYGIEKSGKRTAARAERVIGNLRHGRGV